MHAVVLHIQERKKRVEAQTVTVEEKSIDGMKEVFDVVGSEGPMSAFCCRGGCFGSFSSFHFR